MMKPEELAVVYAKYRNGDPISDGELNLAIPAIKEHAEFLRLLGERFHFVWLDLYNCFIAFESFSDSRKQDRETRKDAAAQRRIKAIKEIVKQVKDEGMSCNCDLDAWQPEAESGHSWVCNIHKESLHRFLEEQS